MKNFCGILICEKERRRPEVNLYVTDRRQFSAIRNECIAAIKEFIDKWLQVDKNASKAFSPFTKFTTSEEEIRAVHQSIAPDLDLATLAIQYQDLQENVDIPKDNPYIVLQGIVKGYSEEYADVALVLARILVCKPHSADCERFISLSNKVKSTSRASCQRQTASDYLYINPPLEHRANVKPSATTCTLIHL